MAYGSCNKKLEFLSNGHKIKRDEKRKIKDFFHGNFYASIIIVEFQTLNILNEIDIIFSKNNDLYIILQIAIIKNINCSQIEFIEIIN